jgi:hypothetical protein
MNRIPILIEATGNINLLPPFHGFNKWNDIIAYFKKTLAIDKKSLDGYKTT